MPTVRDSLMRAFRSVDHDLREHLKGLLPNQEEKRSEIERTISVFADMRERFLLGDDCYDCSILPIVEHKSTRNMLVKRECDTLRTFLAATERDLELPSNHVHRLPRVLMSLRAAFKEAQKKPDPPRFQQTWLSVAYGNMLS